MPDELDAVIDDIKDIITNHMDEWRPDADEDSAEDFDRRIEAAATAIFQTHCTV